LACDESFQKPQRHDLRIPFPQIHGWLYDNAKNSNSVIKSLCKHLFVIFHLGNAVRLLPE